MLPSPAAKAVEMQPRSTAAARITEMIAAELFLTDISFLPFKNKMRPPQITEGARHGEAAPRRSCTMTPSDCPKVLTIILRRKAGIPTVTAMAVVTDFHRSFPATGAQYINVMKILSQEANFVNDYRNGRISLPSLSSSSPMLRAMPLASSLAVGYLLIYL